MKPDQQKALARINKIATEEGWIIWKACDIDVFNNPLILALLQAENEIIALQAELEAHKQEVSDAVEAVIPVIETWVGNHDHVGKQTADPLRRFIIPDAKPDPLMETVVNAMEDACGPGEPVEWYNRFSAQLAKHGLKIVEAGDEGR